IALLFFFVNTFFQKNQKFFRLIAFNTFDYRKGLEKCRKERLAPLFKFGNQYQSSGYAPDWCRANP
ncbi:MAG: hypothetical protein IJJ93_03730, partial [Acidaminococcaceae bacterium]|nr:hypothetical protein [Acidaminococcaceae bacterium]